MKHRHSPKYLVKREEVYYFRMAIPISLQTRFGWKELKASLHTDNRLAARLRSRYLANRFEELFMVVAAAAELTQEQLQSIARGYFHELLIDGNDRIFWIEEMFNNSDEDRISTIENTENRETELRQLHQQGEAAKLFNNVVQAKLEKQGITGITPGSDSHRILADYFVRAQIESNRILRAKLKQDYPAIQPIDPLYAGIMDDTLPPLPQHNLGAPNTTVSLENAVEKFMKSHEQAWEYKSRLDYARVMKWFMECMGPKKPLQTITTQNIGEFRDILLRIPKNYSKTKGNEQLLLKEAIATMQDSPSISPRTADKYLIITRTFLNWCENEGHIDKVPGKKIAIEYKTAEKPRLPFSNEQLVTLFTSPIWRGCFSESRRSRPGTLIFRNSYYWIPLIAAYTGMRSGEIVQLQHQDILKHDDIPYIDINDDNQKKLKTKYSRRRIPIHPRLKEWGFMEFVAGRYDGNPERRIFEEISINRHGDPSHAYSKTFARYMTDIGIKNSKLTFHSFRHTVSDALDNASVIEAHKRAMMGHSDKSASAQYGLGTVVTVLLEAISRVSYDFEKVFNAPSAPTIPPEGTKA